MSNFIENSTQTKLNLHTNHININNKSFYFEITEHMHLLGEIACL